ncbi:alpha/beta hydrolase [Clostridium sp. Ade.TY]|uniref:alpha/beta hydrolase n=1 Tax=Clostridium sp. Ade.TY TaxID=1391647 RepID=UPI00041AD3B3|nr:alpha/beta hydrolase [Clostridium sp. Ade.TY]
MNNVINSYWGVELKPLSVKQGSETLAIVLPGIGYTLDRVTLEYASELVLKLGYDLMKIEYGFQAVRKSFDVAKEFDIAAKETLEQVNRMLNSNYKNIVIIGKSIGTCLQNVLNENIKGYNITNVYISPIDKTVNMGIKENALVITGSKDPLLTKENLNKIANLNGEKLIEFEGANHALNIEKDPIDSLRIQMDIIKAIEDYLK